ncbi:hypothetical protein FDECE_13915 [Fusarium decemcellulare]|nr:hypothetical protein FDECE_13915 [Fusarium decemcellulare]
MAAITDRWVAYLRRKKSEDELANDPRSGDGGSPYSSGSCKRPIRPASPESMSLDESDAETNLAKRRTPPPPNHAEDTHHHSPVRRSRARPDHDAEVRRPSRSSGRQLWTPETEAPRREPRQRPPLAAAIPASNNNDDHDSNEDTYSMLRQPETRPISQEQLVAEVKGIYAGLVMVESKCIQVDNAQSSSTESSKLTNEQWQALIALHRTLLHEHHDFFLASSPVHQNLPRANVQKLASRYSVRSRGWRRLNDRLLPLLRREQDAASLEQWSAVTRLSSSLIHILSENESALDHPEMELQDLLDQIEAILARLQMRFRRKYDELRQKKGLAELFFEFPDNIRHICTTMPWTISPVLVVLWGVCWMFIRPDDAHHEKPTAAGPTIAPSPAAYDPVCTNTAGKFPLFLTEIHLTGGSYVSKFSFPYGEAGMTGDLFDPLGLIHESPQDPNFLTMDPALSSDTHTLELSEEDISRLAETLSAATPPKSVTQSYPRTEQHSSAELAINVVLIDDGDQNVNSDSASQESNSRLVCPDCKKKKTFATPFTLNRHREEKHMQTTSTSEKLFPCPHSNCKRSKEKPPFKRSWQLKRHLETCKHNRDTSSSQEEREYTPSTSVSHDDLRRPAALSVEAAEINSREKRPRLENEDDDLSDEQLVRGMMKKYRRLSEEVEEKKREYLRSLNELEGLAATIQVLRRKNKGDA